MHMIVCPDPDELSRFVVGGLDDAAIERLGEHLGTCEACRRKADAAFAQSDLANALGDTPDTAHTKEDGLRRAQAALARGVVGRSADDTVTKAGPEEDDASAAPPEFIGPYRVVGTLGRGGMGVVYLAEDPQLRRQVAVKVMKTRFAANAGARRRFLQEARSAAMLSHDHVVPIYQVGEERGVPYIAMPLLRGESLHDLLKKSGPLPAEQIIALGGQLAAGLAAAHGAGLIHRDIKPANIWVEPVNGGRVKILDFGLARSVGDDAGLTESGVILGTPEYMAPEQAQDTPVDHRCDLFSLGCVLYKMATGAVPFPGRDTMGILMALASKDPAPPHALNPLIPAGLSALILNLLEKDPARRPATADAVIQALAALPAAATVELKSPSAETEPAAPAVHPVPTARRRWAPALLAVALLALVSAGAYQLVFTSKDGTLVVDVDGAADVRFKDGRVELYDEAGAFQYAVEPGARSKDVSPGKYVVKVVGADGLTLDTDRFEMRKGGKVTVRVTAEAATVAHREPAKVDSPPNDPPAPFSDADVKRIAALPAAQQVEEVRKELKRRNPDFVATLDAAFEGGAVTGLEFDAEHVADISPLRALTRLRDISIYNGPLTDLTPLTGMKLTKASLFECHQLKDLTPLRGMALEELALWNWSGSDLRPLTGMPLRVLSCGGCRQKLDLTPLAGMPLQSLYMNATQVSDLTPLKDLPLTRLHCGETEVSDLSPLRGLKLIELNLDGTNVSDLSPLNGMPLQTLQVSRAAVTDLTPIREMPLTEIRCDFKPLRDAQLLRDIKTLKRINGVPAAVFLAGGRKKKG